MKVTVHHTSFNLSRDTESILRTSGALQFFKDNAIPFTEEFVDSYVGAKENRIVWHESTMPFELPITSIEHMQQYSKKYNLEFVVKSETVTVTF